MEWECGYFYLFCFRVVVTVVAMAEAGRMVVAASAVDSEALAGVWAVDSAAAEQAEVGKYLENNKVGVEV